MFCSIEHALLIMAAPSHIQQWTLNIKQLTLVFVPRDQEPYAQCELGLGDLIISRVYNILRAHAIRVLYLITGSCGYRCHGQREWADDLDLHLVVYDKLPETAQAALLQPLNYQGVAVPDDQTRFTLTLNGTYATRHLQVRLSLFDDVHGEKTCWCDEPCYCGMLRNSEGMSLQSWLAIDQPEFFRVYQPATPTLALFKHAAQESNALVSHECAWNFKPKHVQTAIDMLKHKYGEGEHWTRTACLYAENQRVTSLGFGWGN